MHLKHIHSTDSYIIISTHEFQCLFLSLQQLQPKSVHILFFHKRNACHTISLLCYTFSLIRLNYSWVGNGEGGHAYRPATAQFLSTIQSIFLVFVCIRFVVHVRYEPQSSSRRAFDGKRKSEYTLHTSHFFSFLLFPRRQFRRRFFLLISVLFYRVFCR